MVENAGDSQNQAGSQAVLSTVEDAGAEVVTELDKKEEAKILWKIDVRLIPLLSFLYLIAFIDKGNLGNAKIAGMTEDLELHGNRYNVALTIFFISYVVFEVPSNIILKMMRPSVWIAILLFSWGLVTTLMGIVHNYAGLLACRFFLGVAEAGFFPAATYLLTLWYRRYELQTRMAVLYAAASLSGAFSGLLAFGLQHMKGVARLNGWQWILIIEGLIPVVISLFVWRLLPDMPETAKFLTKAEREFVINRVACETGSGKGKVTNNDNIRPSHVVGAFKEWKTWLAVLVFFGNSVGVYGFTSTAPTVMEQLGYRSAQAQLMTVPIYVFAMVVTLLFAWLSDRYKQRSPFIIAGFSISAVGFAAQLAIPHPNLPGLTYAFCFLIAAGIYSPLVCIVSWISGNLGGIIGSNVYVAAQAPKYPAGYGSGLGSSLCAIVSAIILRFAYKNENEKRSTFLSKVGEEEVRSRYTEEELLQLGDESPFFIYAI